jgi:hypothetical protein
MGAIFRAVCRVFGHYWLDDPQSQTQLCALCGADKHST